MQEEMKWQPDIRLVGFSSANVHNVSHPLTLALSILKVEVSQCLARAYEEAQGNNAQALPNLADVRRTILGHTYPQRMR
jgi:hypothetical protein